MALKVYESLEINAKDFGELSCKECARSGRSIESLTFCVGCDSFYCLECLLDHQDDERKTERNNKWKNTTFYSDVEHKSSTLFENNNRYHSMACMIQQHKQDNKLTVTKELLEQLHSKLNKMMDAETAEMQERLEKLLVNTEKKLDNFNSCIRNLVDKIKSQILETVYKLHKEIEEEFSVKMVSLARLQTKTEAALKKINDNNSENAQNDLVDFANQIKADTDKIEQDTDGYYSNIAKNATQAEWQTRDAALVEAMDGFICDLYALVKCLTDDDNNNDDDDIKISNIPLTQHNIQTECDRRICDINSSCFMTDGTIILTDWNNSNIKWLNKNYDVINVCTLPGIPWAVCCYGDNEVLVSLYLLQRIQFITFKDNKIKLGQSFKVRNPCKGITYCCNKIFVSCGGNGIMDCQGQIQVYDTDGNFLQTYKNDNSGIPIFSNPQHLVTTLLESEYKLFIADTNLGLISIDVRKHGSQDEDGVQKINTEGKVSEAKGICQRTNQSILLCDFKQGNIVEIEYIGNDYKTRILLNPKDSVVNLNSVCFNEKQKKLIVTSGNSNEIQVYDLNLRVTFKEQFN